MLKLGAGLCVEIALWRPLFALFGVWIFVTAATLCQCYRVTGVNCRHGLGDLTLTVICDLLFLRLRDTDC